MRPTVLPHGAGSEGFDGTGPVRGIVPGVADDTADERTTETYEVRLPPGDMDELIGMAVHGEHGVRVANSRGGGLDAEHRRAVRILKALTDARLEVQMREWAATGPGSPDSPADTPSPHTPPPHPAQ
jgi:hypothetical protein